MAKNTTSTSTKSDGNDTTAKADETYLTTTVPTLRIPTDNRDVALVDFPSTAIAYLLQYGLNKTMQDAASGLMARARDVQSRLVANEYDDTPDGRKLHDADTKGLKVWAEELGRSPSSLLALDPEEFSTSIAHHAQEKRLADVLAGKMDIPGSGLGRSRGIDRIIREIAEATITARAKAAGIKLASLNMPSLVSSLLAQEEDARTIRAEAERRMDMERALAGTPKITIPQGGTIDLASLGLAKS